MKTVGWVRDDKNDYDAWAKVVGDPRWSYEGFLPYFKKTEHYHTKDLDAFQHGYDGPLYTQPVASSGRGYPLTENIKRSWEELGVERGMDANAGNPMGIAMVTENLGDGKRQIASDVYTLEGVTVLTGAVVASVVLEGNKAVGVELVDGRVFKASEEVILSAGAIATLQILLLSGIGAKEDLVEHGIEQPVDAPEVGKNFHEHMCVSQWWQLKEPEKGLAANPVIPSDGSHVTTTVMAMLPTSRGTVTLASKDPVTPPRIDPNYYATEADRYVVRTALRKLMQVMMETKEGKAMVKEQVVATGQNRLSPRSSDEDIDELVRECGSGISHTAGTASMGTVVDSNLRVNGVQGLRVVDASVIPVPLAAHLQAFIYALAEQATEIIVQERGK
ncbi:GMC oxidoreductase [Hyaloscypha variabilis F]|uniref:GMC oxidoreductase n=1 Tax=Hyaloscypha variabilis (strain UAMH 11265 / GT02V1 / F) TaxID=1149755 RepID=A0A2J6R5U4_HYAVF|nr:GMC oxidoreductase [Hyaloscypha variabilis F]